MIRITRNSNGSHVSFDLLGDTPEFTCLTTLRCQNTPAGSVEKESFAGIPADRIARARQVHSDHIIIVDSPDGIPGPKPEADGIISLEPGIFSAVSTADCVPVVLVHEKTRACAVIHAGWRGTCAGITGKAASQLIELTSGKPEDIQVFTGPCIHSCCYEVGDEVIQEFADRGHNLGQILKGHNLDLVKANLLQAVDLGVTDITNSGFCTSCTPDLFYSYRREKTASRMLTIAGFRNKT